MARFLFFAVPLAGHVLPGLLVAQWLVEQGHEVRWYSSSKWRARIEATGAQWLGVKRAKDYDDDFLLDAFPEIRGKRGMAMAVAEAQYVFMGQYPYYTHDLREILETYPADVLVGESPNMVPGLIREQGGPPWAIYNISVNSISGDEVPPFGLAMPYIPSFFGRLRNRIVNWMVPNVAFRGMVAQYNQVRAEFALPPRNFFPTDDQRSADLFMMSTIPAFEYPRSDMGDNYQFVGPLVPPPPAHFTPPIWWHELESGKPVIHVTQGTMANHDFHDLLIPTMHALANEDMLVIATTGKKVEPSVLGTIPDNVRVEDFIPYAMLLPHVDVMVSNGGYGGCQSALRYGVPMVVAGRTEDKMEVTARVAYSGLGINLNVQTPKEPQLLAAVKKLLAEPKYKERAKELAAQAAAYDSRTIVVTALTQLAQRQKLPKSAIHS